MSRDYLILLKAVLVLIISLSSVSMTQSQSITADEVLQYLGLKQAEAPKELVTTIETIVKRNDNGGRDKSTFEIDVEALQKQWEVIRDQIQDFVNSSAYRTYADVPVALVGHFGDKILGLATLDEAKKIYNIYADQPELFKSIAVANQGMLWEQWSMFLGDTKPLDEGLDQFLQVAEVVSFARSILIPFRDERLRKLAKKGGKKKETKSEL